MQVLNHMEKMAYRIPEAVQVTGIGRSKLYELIQQGSLKAIKVGGRTLITRAELEALLQPRMA